MKNVVFMMNVDLAKEGRFASSRTDPYKYSIDSWKRWCDKNDCELFVLQDRIYDESYMNANWHKLFAFQLLEANSIDYNQILIV